jgi:DNA-directed RNA polymerase subunit M/transcription elongation factor TFIIS
MEFCKKCGSYLRKKVCDKCGTENQIENRLRKIREFKNQIKAVEVVSSQANEVLSNFRKCNMKPRY